MAPVPYAKPHASAEQRVAHLRTRGLLIPRPTVAAKKIELVGYERLRIYFISRRQTGVTGKPFVAGTTYQNILRLYECDEQLRNVCFRGVANFEILLRNSLAEKVGDVFGSHPYFELAAFKDATANIEAIKTFTGVYTKSTDPRAKHYRVRYSSPILPPLWTMKEFLTFGATSYLLTYLAGNLRSNIASEFGVGKDTVFINWVKCLVDLRNICAHHDRLFNRHFQKQPSILSSAALPTAPINKLKAILQCLEYMLNSRGVKSQIVTDVEKILRRFPEVHLHEAGF